MTPDQRFSILCILLTFALAGVGAIFRSLWKISKEWIKTVDQLQALGEDIKEMNTNKEKEHIRLEVRDDRLEARLERHEQWHTGQVKPL